MTVAIAAGLLTAGAVYLFMKREMLRVVLGFILLGHAGNLILIAAGGTDKRVEPFGTAEDPSVVADPLPQAFVLTAIVIAFAITIFMLVLAVTGGKNDDTHGEGDIQPAPLPGEDEEDDAAGSPSAEGADSASGPEGEAPAQGDPAASSDTSADSEEVRG